MRPNEQCTVGTRGIDAKNIWTLQTHGPCGLLRRLINGVYYAVPSVVRSPDGAIEIEKNVVCR